jgi:hypothetical protein
MDKPKKEEGSWPNINNIYHGAIIIIFSLTSLEAFVNDIIKISNKDNENKTEKEIYNVLRHKDLKYKIKLIYKTKNVEISDNDKIFEIFDELKDYRDWLVHYKNDYYIEFSDSTDHKWLIDFLKKKRKKGLPQEPFSYIDCLKYYNCIIDIMIKILRLFGNLYKERGNKLKHEDYTIITGICNFSEDVISFEDKL